MSVAADSTVICDYCYHSCSWEEGAGTQPSGVEMEECNKESRNVAMLRDFTVSPFHHQSLTCLLQRSRVTHLWKKKKELL